MSAEINKILCAILSAILVLLLSSFIGDLLYHPSAYLKKPSYQVASEKTEEKQIEKMEEKEEERTITQEQIKSLMLVASLESGEKFVTKNCSACHSFTLPIKNKIGPSLANVINRKIASESSSSIRSISNFSRSVFSAMKESGTKPFWSRDTN